MNNKLIAEFMGMEFGDDGTISYDDAENIRNKYNNEKISHRKLGEQYGVSHRAIQQIINYDTYKFKGEQL